MENSDKGASGEAPKRKRIRITKTDIRQTALSVWFKTTTPELMKCLSTRGINSPDNVIRRASAANTATGETRTYLEQLAGSSTLGSGFGIKDAVSIVSVARNRRNLPAFTGKVQQQCLEELQRVFIIKTAMVETSGVRHRVYVAVFKLLAD